jgi:RIO-like serine/threonine protein kinase
VSPKQEEVKRWLIQALYQDYEKENYISSSKLSIILEIDELLVINGLSQLVESNLVDKDALGYKLSENGYSVAFQRDTSYCPHL